MLPGYPHHIIQRGNRRQDVFCLLVSAQIGISASHDSWEFSARARYLGLCTLTADNTQRLESLTTVNLRLAYHWREIAENIAESLLVLVLH